MKYRVLRLCVLLAVAGLACQPATQQAVDDGSKLAALLDAHARAHGFQRDTPRDRALHVLASVDAFGMEGTLEVWSEPPLYARARLDVGPLGMETGFDGQAGWILDRNGTLRSAEGTEHVGMLLDALMSTGAYVLTAPPVELGRSLVAKTEQQGDAPQAPDETVVLSLQVEGGEPQRLTIDASSFQLRSTQWHNGQFLDETRFQDYRPVDGRLVAHRVTMDYGPSMQLKARVIRAEHMEPQGAAFYRSPASDAQPSPSFAQGDDSGVIPFALHLEHIFVSAVLNGSHNGSFLVDTGAGSNVLHARYLDELGLETDGEVQAVGAVGATEGSFVHVEQLQTGGMTLPEQTWVAVDLTDVESALGRRILGVLGYDTLSRVVLEIDYDERWLRFHTPETYQPDPTAQRLVVRMDSNIPSTLAMIEGVPGWVHLDTGSDNALDLMAPFVATHDLLEGRVLNQRTTVQGVGGAGSALRGTLRGFELGDFRFEEVPTSFNSESEGIFGSASIAGVVGAGLLRRFHCVFDYPGGAVWLTPGESALR